MISPGGQNSAIASSAIDTGDVALARSELAIATILLDEVMGHDSLEAIQTRMMRPWLARAEADPARAKIHARSSVTDCTKHLGSAHPLTAEANRTLGYMLDARDKLPDAVAAYQEAIAIMKRSGGGQLRTTAQYQQELGEVLLAMGRFEDAQTALASALAIEEANRSERTRSARNVRYLLAEAQRGARRWSESVKLLESLVTELAHDPADPMLHQARMWLGIDLARTGGDVKRARGLVTAARIALAKLDPDAARTAAAWLRAGTAP